MEKKGEWGYLNNCIKDQSQEKSLSPFSNFSSLFSNELFTTSCFEIFHAL